MNYTMVKHLIWKDWHFSRGIIVFYIAAGALSLFLLGLGNEQVFYMGSVLFFTVLIGLSIHLVMATVIYERKEQTLPFIMSLPVSPMEYTTAKILANVLIFLVPWLTLVVGTFALISGRAWLPNGLLPLTAILVMEIFVAYSLLLAVSLITESLAWTISVVVASNLFFNFFLFFTSQLPSISESMEGPVAVWSPTVWGILGAEVVLLLLFLGATFYFQGRKTDFL